MAKTTTMSRESAGRTLCVCVNCLWEICFIKSEMFLFCFTATFTFYACDLYIFVSTYDS